MEGCRARGYCLIRELRRIWTGLGPRSAVLCDPSSVSWRAAEA